MDTKQYDFIKSHTSLSHQTICIYVRIIDRLKKKTDKTNCQKITIPEIESFIANLPGSIKPQAFATMRLVYGKLLYDKMPPEFQKSITWFINNSPKQKQTQMKSSIHYTKIVEASEDMPFDMKILCFLILGGIRLSEIVNIDFLDVGDSLRLPDRRWEVPEHLKNDILFLKHVAKKTGKLFPKKEQTYAYHLRKQHLNAAEIRRSGIEKAFEQHQNAYFVWNQFGIFSNSRRAYYWKLYGK